MMHKTAYLVRHAKSSWDDFSLSDFDRPLNDRGRRDAPIMAKNLWSKVPDIDLFICSGAKRARETCAYFIKGVPKEKVLYTDHLYHAGPDEILEVLYGIDRSIDTVVLFGHNPGFTYMHNRYADDLLDNLPTCGIFRLRIEADWPDMDTTNTSAGDVIYPKMYVR